MRSPLQFGTAKGPPRKGGVRTVPKILIAPELPATRLESLDAFRGLAIAGMILVNNPGSWNHVYPPLAHAEWHGWTPTDLIFPFFLFILGVAIPFSFGKRMSRGAAREELLGHVIRRSLILFGLGLFMAAFPRFELGDLRIMGVLQRIGLVYAVAAPFYLYSSQRGRWVASAIILLLYWGLMTLVPVPGYGAGDLSPEGNLAAYLDRALLPGRLWQETWDPEGLLSTLPAIVTPLLGIQAGTWLRSGEEPGSRVARMVAAGSAATALGWLWGLWFPVNKNLWTSSYVLLTAGIALLGLALFYWAIDVRGRKRWAYPLVVYGRNAIAVFVASGLLAKMLGIWRVEGAGGSSAPLKAWLYEHGFASWAGPMNGSLAFALCYVLFWLALMWGLDARRIYIKI